MTKYQNWSREELILAFNLYCRTSFGKIHRRNPDVIELGILIQRSASAVAWKLANFARLDPAIQSRGLSGATHGSKGELEIWNEFHSNWDELSYESEYLRAKLQDTNLEDLLQPNEPEIFLEGKEREAIVRLRVNQRFFRETVLSAYRNMCCITSLDVPELLIASHIIPWATDPTNRINPRNGLCLNALHDRAFDRGLMTITDDYRILLASLVKDNTTASVREWLQKYEGQSIRLPEKFRPDVEFLQFHREYIFQSQ